MWKDVWEWGMTLGMSGRSGWAGKAQELGIILPTSITTSSRRGHLALRKDGLFVNYRDVNYSTRPAN